MTKGHLYSEIHPDKVLFTIKRLGVRIKERFPDSSLLQVCNEFQEKANIIRSETEKLKKPIWYARILTILSGMGLILLTIVLIEELFDLINKEGNSITKIFNPSDYLQSLEAGLNAMILLAVAFISLLNLENSIKRNRTLKYIKQLFNITHLVDMLQLTKDPTAISEKKSTGSSPSRITNTYDLNRYLDYCSELLSLVSKVGALLSQSSNDPVILENVNDLSALTQGSSNKIWQKIMITRIGDD